MGVQHGGAAWGCSMGLAARQVFQATRKADQLPVVVKILKVHLAPTLVADRSLLTPRLVWFARMASHQIWLQVF